MLNIKSKTEEIEQLIQQDPGNRGLSKWAIDGNLFPASLSLAKGKHIIITTGFYILNSGAIETDGPPGAIILAKALMEMGKSVTIITDDHAREITEAGMTSVNCKAELITFAADKVIDYKEIFREDTTHFIALERPGAALDGYHYNFRRNIISDFVAPIDPLYVKSAELGIKTIAIGDGGNELGMGNIMYDEEFCCSIKSDFCICAGVSNWAGYAIAGILSYLSDKNLMVDFNNFDNLLTSIVEAGAVDGVSGKQEATVDGLERSWEDRIYNDILTMTEVSE